MIDKQLLEQALEALEDRSSLLKWQTARDAIRARLEQPEQEPVAELLKQSRANFDRNFGKGGQGWADWIYADLLELLDTTPPAAPVQEPVAWLQFKNNEPPAVAPRNLGTPVFLGIRGGLVHDVNKGKYE